MVTWQVLRISTARNEKTQQATIGEQASAHVMRVCFCFLVWIPHAISIWNIIPGSLLPLFKCDRMTAPEGVAASAPSLS